MPAIAMTLLSEVSTTQPVRPLQIELWHLLIGALVVGLLILIPLMLLASRARRRKLERGELPTWKPPGPFGA